MAWGACLLISTTDEAWGLDGNLTFWATLDETPSLVCCLVDGLGNLGNLGNLDNLGNLGNDAGGDDAGDLLGHK